MEIHAGISILDLCVREKFFPQIFAFDEKYAKKYGDFDLSDFASFKIVQKLEKRFAKSY